MECANCGKLVQSRSNGVEEEILLRDAVGVDLPARGLCDGCMVKVLVGMANKIILQRELIGIVDWDQDNSEPPTGGLDEFTVASHALAKAFFRACDESAQQLSPHDYRLSLRSRVRELMSKRYFIRYFLHNLRITTEARDLAMKEGYARIEIQHGGGKEVWKVTGRDGVVV